MLVIVIIVLIISIACSVSSLFFVLEMTMDVEKLKMGQEKLERYVSEIQEQMY